MTTLREYFEEESADCLGRLDALAGAGDADPAELLRAARALRGTAQMAREDRAWRAAAALEEAVRALADGNLGWGDDVRERIRSTVSDLRALVAGSDGEAAQDARVASVRERWSLLGVPLDDGGAAAAHGTAASAGTHDAGADAAFRAFATREVAAIAAALTQGVDALMADPHDREPLKAILRRQRPLLGTARLDELAIVAESLRAVEDISRVIARLDVAIKDEWLDVFRSAREIMRAASSALERGEEPRHTNALSRLRTLHSELLDRFGATESGPASTVVPDVIAQASAAVPAAQPGVDAAADEAEQPEATGDEPLDIADLMYDRDDALRRIAELRPRIERGLGADADARAALEELFDLLRLALG